MQARRPRRSKGLGRQRPRRHPTARRTSECSSTMSCCGGAGRCCFSSCTPPCPRSTRRCSSRPATPSSMCILRRCAGVPPPTRLLRRASHVAAPRALTSGVPSAVSLSNLDGRLRRDAQMPDCLGNDSMQGSICLHDADAMPALRPDPRGALQGLRLQPIRQPLQAQARVTAEHAARRRHTLFLLNPPSYWRHPPWHGALD